LSRPRAPVRHLPNIICLARIALIWPIVASLQAGDYAFTVVLFLIAAVSDGLDGYLAKRFGWTSEFGKFIDPLADKLLLVVMFVAASWLQLVPWWLAAAAVARDVMIGLGALTFRLWFGPLRGRPTIISKINTLLQLGYLLGVVMRAAFEFPPAEILDALAVITLVTIALSGGDYVFAFTRRAWDEPTGQRGTVPATSAGKAGRQ
jgi:cardiolipin synthase (CMP-forming)